MNSIIYPDKLDSKFYEKTILANPNVILDGFYYGTFDRTYEESRVELVNSYKFTYTCDYWLDGYYWHDNLLFLSRS